MRPENDRYDMEHWKMRQRYAWFIKDHGFICMERECVKGSRLIWPGAKWHLAHDHQSSDPHAYLGPAHPECNEREAESRGVTWDDAPDSNPDPPDPWDPIPEF